MAEKKVKTHRESSKKILDRMKKSSAGFAKKIQRSPRKGK